MGDLDDLTAAVRAKEQNMSGGNGNEPPMVTPPTPQLQTIRLPVAQGGMISNERTWTVHDQGRQFGPHTEMEVAMLFAPGAISPSALIWREGAPRWIPVTAVVPMPAGATLNYSTPRGPRMTGITIPILISAIGNIIVGLFWALTCFGVVFTVPMVVLCVFEFILYFQADSLPPMKLAGRAKTIAIVEIILGLFNTVSLVCGIVVLVHAAKLSKASKLGTA